MPCFWTKACLTPMNVGLVFSLPTTLRTCGSIYTFLCDDVITFLCMRGIILFLFCLIRHKIYWIIHKFLCFFFVLDLQILYFFCACTIQHFLLMFINNFIHFLLFLFVLFYILNVLFSFMSLYTFIFLYNVCEN